MGFAGEAASRTLRHSAVATATVTRVAPHDLRLLRLKRAPRRLVQRFPRRDLSAGCPQWQLDFQWPAASGVVRWSQGAGFCLYQTLKLLHWVLSGGAGWPGRGSGFQANSIIQTPRNFQEALNWSYLHRCLFVGTWLHRTGGLIRSRSSRPARTARQYPMLDAPYIPNFTGLNDFYR